MIIAYYILPNETLEEAMDKWERDENAFHFFGDPEDFMRAFREHAGDDAELQSFGGDEVPPGIEVVKVSLTPLGEALEKRPEAEQEAILTRIWRRKARLEREKLEREQGRLPSLL